MPASRKARSDSRHQVVRRTLGHREDDQHRSVPEVYANQESKQESAIAEGNTHTDDESTDDDEESYEELEAELHRLQVKYALARLDLFLIRAEERANEALIAICEKERDKLRVEMEQGTDSKPRKPITLKSRARTLQEYQAAHEVEVQKLKNKERAEEEKEARRQAELDRIIHIFLHGTKKTFYRPLTSYKLRDDLQTIACAFGLDIGPTNSELTENIRRCMIEHPYLRYSPRFAALFQERRRTAGKQPYMQSLGLMAASFPV